MSTRQRASLKEGGQSRDCGHCGTCVCPLAVASQAPMAAVLAKHQVPVSTVTWAGAKASHTDTHTWNLQARVEEEPCSEQGPRQLREHLMVPITR